MRCPRCDGQELSSGHYRGVPVARCGGCGGVFVEIRHNIQFLEQLSRQLAQDVEPDTEIAANPGQVQGAACPKCGAAMTRFGYMGTNKVFLDRCSPCMALWHDGDELATTAALHARTTRRSDERIRARHVQNQEQDRRLFLMTLAREAMDRGFSS